jgi:CheY-like chemotaxis protein
MDPTLPILIAEDSEDDACLVRYALEKAGLPNPTHICKYGVEVLDYLQGSGAYVDRQKYPFPRLMILDLKMPRKTGLDVLQWIKDHPKCGVIPMVILTSSSEPRDISEAYRLGANAYMVKPGNNSELQEMLRRLHLFWSSCELPEIPGNC